MKRIDERRRALASGARAQREGVVDAFLAEQWRLEQELRGDSDEDTKGESDRNATNVNGNSNASANETPHLFPGSSTPDPR